jgi:Tol biopolymer transport system component
MARRTAGGTLLSVTIACALIAAAIVTGLRVPAVRPLAPFPPRSVLDYEATFRSALAPLRPGFIREVLGGLDPVVGDPRGNPSPGAAEGVPRLAYDPYPPRIVRDYPFTNDDMQDALAIESIPFTGRTDTRQASREPGEPEDCGSGGGTAWYRYRSTRDENLIANTFGTDYAVRLTVFATSGDGSLTLVGCDSDVRGSGFVQFEANEGNAYLFQIAAQAVGGRLVFNLEPTGLTELVSSTPSGDPGTGQNLDPSLSADGSRIAFHSWAPDLHPQTPRDPCHTRAGMPPMSYEDANTGDYLIPCAQVYVRDGSSGAMLLASVSSSGEPGDLDSLFPWISGNGRFVAFASQATNLVPNDTNHAWDVFVHDLENGRTERVSLSSTGKQIEPDVTRREEAVRAPSMSHDGRYVAFSSVASDLVPDDTNDVSDVFVHDRVSRRTERVSITSKGEEATAGSTATSISPDGRYVVFVSAATNLVARRTNGRRHVFLRDRVTRTTETISISSTGEEANDDAGNYRSVISADGRYVVFDSSASNLSEETDDNDSSDIFVRDRVTRRTTRVSVTSSGEQADGPSRDGAISLNGRYVAFTSPAENLAEGSRNEQTIPIREDLYVRDLRTQTTARITVAPEGEPLDVRYPFLSADGRTIAFTAVHLRVPPSLVQVWVHERPRVMR